ncbi:MAG: protein TolQ [Pseudomonadota bacterium]
MQDQVTQTTDLGGVVHDFSAFGMFMQADLVVKSVMVLLLLVSFWSWAIIIDKLIAYRRIRQRADAFEDRFWSGSSLDDLYQAIAKQADHPLALIFSSAMREWQRSLAKSARFDPAAVAARIATIMRVTREREMGLMEKRLGFLATVGSVAPFVGLFGTVWGIMNSFQSIATSQNTSLAVVAPGIAEALFATALGLLAAIPAVAGYNKLTGELGRFGQRLESFCEEFSTIISRQLEDKAA